MLILYYFKMTANKNYHSFTKESIIIPRATSNNKDGGDHSKEMYYAGFTTAENLKSAWLRKKIICCLKNRNARGIQPNESFR